MTARVWRGEMVVGREVRGVYKEVWTPCTLTMYRTRPRLALETDPFSVDNFKTVLSINSDLTVSYKCPISRDFRLYLKSRSQVRSRKIESV